jgi:hypothetical protein
MFCRSAGCSNRYWQAHLSVNKDAAAHVNAVLVVSI